MIRITEARPYGAEPMVCSGNTEPDFKGEPVVAPKR